MKKWIGMLVFSLLLGTVFATPAEVEFVRMTPASAAQKALDEGKFYMLSFTASWCSPCQWMEETTYRDPSLAGYMNESVVAVKIDIDDLDGYALKQRFEVKVLPTMLLFNSEGRLLERIEETLAPSKMKALIQQHDRPENRVMNKPLSDVFSMQTHRPPAYSTPVYSSTVNPIEEVNPTNIHRPALGRPALVPSAVRPSVPDDIDIIESKPITPAPNPASPFATGEGLFRLSVDYQPSEGFSLQTGVYADYANVLREVNKLQGRFDFPVLVNVSKRGNTYLYKVLIGVFESRTQANALKAQLKSEGQDSFVKDLALLK